MEKVGQVEKVQFGEGIVVRIEVLSVLAKQDEAVVYHEIAVECRVTVDGKMEYKCVVEMDDDPRESFEYLWAARIAVNRLFRLWEHRLHRLDDAISVDLNREDAERLAAEQNPSTS